MIRVLIAEDSVTQREILSRLINSDGAFTVVATAANGHEAVGKVIEHSPDVVLMDIHMPDMDGIEATRQIMAQHPLPIVVASATLRKQDVDLALKALEAGAVSVIAKPEGAVLLHLNKIAPNLLDELRAASKANIRPRSTKAVRRASDRVAASPSMPGVIEVIGVCASTGGPPALVQLFSRLPIPVPVPVLLVQHISNGFEEGFARWLAGVTGQNVGLAAQGQRLEPGIWVGPHGTHLTVGSRARISLESPGPNDIHCPSGNPLFESLAKHFQAQAAGVVLTGMGDDGANGLLALRQSGGVTFTQDEASSLIYGMPKAARLLGASRHELPPDGIARMLSQLLRVKPSIA